MPIKKTPESFEKTASPRIGYEEERFSSPAEDFTALFTIAETATQSLDTEKILKETLDKSLEILNFDVGYIRILEPETRNLVVRVARGLSSPQLLRSAVLVDEPSHGKTLFETRKPFISSDVRRDPTFRRRTMAREGVISAALVPVLAKNRAIGVLAAGSRQYHSFTEREINLLMAFAAQLGAALENARLYDELGQRTAYVENLVENAGDAIISSDMQDKILTWNHAAEVVFGYSKEEVEGKAGLAVLVPEERLRELEEIRNKVRFTGVVRNLEVRRQKRDGTTIEVALSVSPIKDKNGEVVSFLRVAKDITEKKRLEQRLKELDKMKSDFVSSVSHELRTPLTAIKGSVDNMLDGITGVMNEKQQRYLTRIKSNADRLSRLINEILDLSRIEAGKVDFKPTNLPLAALVEDVTESMMPVAQAKAVALEVAWGDTEVVAWGEGDKVTEVLMNLVGNAIKFTPDHGKVCIGVRRKGEEWVQISVADTGPGIPAAEVERIFDKFHRVSQQNSQAAKGTGLGLTISKALVEMHGGRIWLESDAGAGSTFFFTLPAHQPLKE